MKPSVSCRGKQVVCLALTLCAVAMWSAACAAVGGPLEYFGSPFRQFSPNAGAQQGGTGGTGGGDGGGAFGGGGVGSGDACDESQSRKFVTITMRNLSDDFVHYFLVLVANVQSDTYPDGAVCPDDVGLYTSFGYTEIPDGVFQEFGNFCFQGPTLIYYHRAGQFRTAGGTGGAQFASAIGPAQGASPTFDTFFTSGGAQVPVPDTIIFHNPGTGQGQALKIARSSNAPCAALITVGNPDCEQDAFYYVDDNDIMTGSTALGIGSGRRVPSEIQGNACECSGFAAPFQQLAPSGVTATNAQCFEYMRGGRIEYAFVREDTNPPFPQLLWRVADASGAVVHDFDARGNVP